MTLSAAFVMDASRRCYHLTSPLRYASARQTPTADPSLLVECSRQWACKGGSALTQSPGGQAPLKWPAGFSATPDGLMAYLQDGYQGSAAIRAQDSERCRAACEAYGAAGSAGGGGEAPCLSYVVDAQRRCYTLPFELTWGGGGGGSGGLKLATACTLAGCDAGGACTAA